MKISQKILSLLTGSALAASGFLNAATTDPVGYVTVETAANSDSKSGITLLRPSVVSLVASSISENTVTASDSFQDVVTEQHYLIFTSGTLAGQWFEITSTSGVSITLSADVTDAEQGSSFQVRPFWTLDSLFPNGQGIVPSSDVDAPVCFILLNNPNAEGTNLAPNQVYFYHDGSQGPAGWYNFDGLTNAGSQPLSPESFLTIRNLTDSPIDTIISGAVPVDVLVNSVVSRSAGAQDNLVFNPYPSEIILSDANLITSGVVRESSDVDNPTDFVLLYSQSISGTNPAPTGVYFYHDGSQGPAGWYNFDGLTTADNEVIPAGAPVIVRRGVGQDELVYWNPPLPYSL